MTATDTILYGLGLSKGMLGAFTADLTGGEWDHRACPGSNCAAWIVGHMILSERRALGLAGVTDLPELPAGFETTFGREADAPHAKSFGDSTALIGMFNLHRDLLMAAIAKLPIARFDEPFPRPNPRFKTVGECFAFISMHTVMHAGQISTIRRSLGRPPLF